MDIILILLFLNAYQFNCKSITRLTESVVDISSGREYAKIINYTYEYKYGIYEKIIYLADGYYFITEREFPSKEYEEFRKSKKSFKAFMKNIFQFFSGKIKKSFRIKVGNNLKTLYLECEYTTPCDIICDGNGKKLRENKIFEYINFYYSDKKIKNLLDIVSYHSINILTICIYSHNPYKKERYKFIEKFYQCEEAEGLLNYDCTKWKKAETLGNAQTIIIK